MKAALATRPVTRAVLHFTIGMMAGLLTFSAYQHAGDALRADDTPTVNLSVNQ